MRIVCASGYFNPIHGGHIDYLEEARKLGDYLVVIVNTDDQSRTKKRESSFMREQERCKIVKSLRCVDEVILSLDKDLTVCNTLRFLGTRDQNRVNIFGNGGDRKDGNIPETDVCKKYKIEMIDGLGEKIQSSSNLINRAQFNNFFF